MAAMLIKMAIIEVAFANRASFLADSASDFANSNCSFRILASRAVDYSGSVVKTKIQAFYNEPISVAELGRCPR